MEKEEIDLSEEYRAPKVNIPKELKKIIDELNENENIASFDRHYYRHKLTSILENIQTI